jgi:F-box domain
MNTLPSELVAHILCMLPLDSKLRCREVSRDWREVLDEERLWSCVRFEGVSLSSGKAFELLLKAAMERAGATYALLDLSGLAGSEELRNTITSHMLVEIIACHHCLEIRGLEDCPRLTQFERSALLDLNRAGQRLRELTLLSYTAPGSLTDAHLLTTSAARIMLRGGEAGEQQLQAAAGAADGGEQPQAVQTPEQKKTTGARRRSRRQAERRGILTDKRILMLVRA